MLWVLAGRFCEEQQLAISLSPDLCYTSHNTRTACGWRFAICPDHFFPDDIAPANHSREARMA
jgi:hypothetical protein